MTAGDAELERELREMLQHSEGAEGRISGTVERIARRAAGGRDWIGRHFGPYRIIREIGRGGMGMCQPSTKPLSLLKTPLRGLTRLRSLSLAVATSPGIWRPEQLPERVALLDKLDALVGFLDQADLPAGFDARVISLARTLQARLESANEELYEAARAEIVSRCNSRLLRKWLFDSATCEEAVSPSLGLGFDQSDDIVSGVLQFIEPDDAELPRSPDMAPYQPTPVRHILDLVAASNLAHDDILIDLGSGLGHVPLMVSILTGIRTLGVERQPS